MTYDGTECKERECPGQSQQRPHGSSSSIFRTTIGFPRSRAASGPRQTYQLATQQLLRRQPDLLDDLLVTSCVCLQARGELFGGLHDRLNSLSCQRGSHHWQREGLVESSVEQ